MKMQSDENGKEASARGSQHFDRSILKLVKSASSRLCNGLTRLRMGARLFLCVPSTQNACAREVVKSRKVLWSE